MPTPLLDFLTVEGFKSIAQIENLQFRPINLVIGPNGAGKSNLIGVFAFLHAIREGRLQDYVRKAGGAEQLLHFGSRVTKRIKIDVSFSDQVNRYRVELEPTSDDSLHPSREEALYWDKYYPKPYDVQLAPRENGLEAGISDPNLTTKTPGWVRERLGSWRIFHVHDTSATSPLRKTAQLNDNAFLRPDGSNLSAFLYMLQQTDRRTYDLIRRTVQQVAPFFGDFILRPDTLNPRLFDLLGSDESRTNISAPRPYPMEHFASSLWRRSCCNRSRIVPQSCWSMSRSSDCTLMR